jgi:hypothetical protein
MAHQGKRKTTQQEISAFVLMGIVPGKCNDSYGLPALWKKRFKQKHHKKIWSEFSATMREGIYRTQWPKKKTGQTRM